MIERLLGQLLTPSELAAVSDRWELCQQLVQGKSQRRIAADLGLSLCKITRGSKELKRPRSTLRTFIERSLPE